MEQLKIADSRAIEIVADEPDPALTENALRVSVVSTGQQMARMADASAVQTQ